MKVERIALTLGGGVCDTGGGDVNRVFWMVLAGPMASVALGISSFAASVVFVVYLTLQGVDASVIAENPHLWMWLVIFGCINLALAVLNLFPFQPLDGGRLVHLGLSRFLHPDRARLIAGCVGLAFGVIWVPFLFWMLTWGLFIPVLPKLQTHWRMIFGRDAGPAVLDIKPILGPVQLLRPLP
ncbi:MAG: site-2 protease family protein [Tateyamaria sp.]|uniref:site-2 protease family protein n=1 Tax=Tateyamaria sp. TaxID=1929288 RepID=UPI0032A0DB11